MPDALYTELEKMNAINQTGPTEPTFQPSFPFGNFDWCSQRGQQLGRISCTVLYLVISSLFFLPLHPLSIRNGVLYIQLARYRLNANNPSHFQKSKRERNAHFFSYSRFFFFFFFLSTVDLVGSRRASILTMFQKAGLFVMRNYPNQ